MLQCSHSLKSLKFVFPSSIKNRIDRKTQNCRDFCKFIKKKKKKICKTLCCDTLIYSAVIHFFWSSLKWFYTFTGVQLDWVKLIGLDKVWHTCVCKTLQLTVRIRADENREVEGSACELRQNCCMIQCSSGQGCKRNSAALKIPKSTVASIILK